MSSIDLIHNYPLLSSADREILDSLSERIQQFPAESISYVPVEGLPLHREIAGHWLKVEPSRVGFGVSGHQFLTSILLGFTELTDQIGCEEITYNGWLNCVRQTGRKNVVIQSDDLGMLPESLNEIATRHKLWGIFLQPSLHNPLCRIMPLARKKALVDVCRKHNLWIIDDDAYRFLNPEPCLSFAHLYAEKSFWLQSLTKPLFPSVKSALIAAPEGAMTKLTEVLRATGHQPSSLTLPWVLGLLQTGKLDQICRDKQIEAKRRQAIAAEIFKGLTYQTFPTSFHLWLTVPKGWTSPGVGIVPGERYYSGSSTPPHAVRIALAGEEDQRLREGLMKIKASL